MSRNKYPDRTEKLIIEVATKLFLEKGYEKTSLNDIIAGLGGLTKGAIYQHFKSKEDILNAVMYQLTAGSDGKLLELINSSDMNAKEKIRAVLLSAVKESYSRKESGLDIDYTKNPLIFIRPIIDVWIRDGSVRTDSPKELSEFLALNLNLWINPSVSGGTPEETAARLRLMSQMLAGIGLDIVDDEFLKEAGLPAGK